MKKNKNLKTVLFNAFIIIAVAFSAASCSNSKPEDPKDVAEDQNEEKFSGNKEDDAQFLVNAAEINLMEIQLGQLASSNAMMSEVKEMGKMMVTDHTKAMSELKELAAKKAITIPEALTEDGQKEYNKMTEKTGKDFDKDYCDKMVDGHKDAIDKFEKAANNATDAEIKQWASSTLPTLRTHLDHAIMCQESVKKIM